VTARRALPALLLAGALTACGTTDPGPVPGPAAVPADVLASASAAAETVSRNENLVWGPEGWPDACALPGSPAGVTLADPAPRAGRRPDGRPPARPTTCSWSVTGGTLPQGPFPEGPPRAALRIHLVTDDPYDIWGAIRFRAGSWRDVENVGDEAMLVTPGPDGREELYVCTGRTIFAVSVTGGPVPAGAARDLLFDVALAADARLRRLPAGLPPTGEYAVPPGEQPPQQPPS
jgi:hypothetical protein